MAKQKRKGPEVTEKKSKKRKQLLTGEMPRVPEARPSEEAASSKTLAASSELSSEERRVLERKLKKERKKEEKKRLREAGITAAQTAKVQTPPARPSAAALALDYLRGWAQKQDSWRFQKTRQTWLLLNMYDKDKVPDEHFSTLLAYLEGLKGSARTLTVQKAEALMQELKEADAPGKALRLRQVLQLLS
uniref:RIKEN cDNA 3110082I17 gene n=1 Tax=Jaculus jaculus TaxID=51337 RepID=A0A8C5LJD9_JACJA